MAVRSPVRLLSVLAALFGVTAFGTARYPAEYLSAPRIHSTIAAVAAAGCLATIAHPTRHLAALAGAVASTVCWVRAALLLGEVLFDSTQVAPEVQVSFILAGSLWATMAVVVTEIWAVAVLPWVAARRTPGDDP